MFKDTYIHIQVFQYLQLELPHGKTNKMTRASSKDSDQPGHPPVLISLRCLHEQALGSWLPIKPTAKTLIRLGECPGSSESLPGAQVILLVLPCCGMFNNVQLVMTYNCCMLLIIGMGWIILLISLCTKQVGGAKVEELNLFLLQRPLMLIYLWCV